MVNKIIAHRQLVLDRMSFQMKMTRKQELARFVQDSAFRKVSYVCKLIKTADLEFGTLNQQYHYSKYHLNNRNNNTILVPS